MGGGWWLWGRATDGEGARQGICWDPIKANVVFFGVDVGLDLSMEAVHLVRVAAAKSPETVSGSVSNMGNGALGGGCMGANKAEGHPRTGLV